MFKMSLALIMLGLSCSVFAVGIPVINPGKPIKISESAIYSCDSNGNALEEGSAMRYKNKTVICRNDNLWADGKALSFVDVTSEVIGEAIKTQEDMKSNGNSVDVININAIYKNGLQTIKFRSVDNTCDYYGKSQAVNDEVKLIAVTHRVCKNIDTSVNMFAQLNSPINLDSQWVPAGSKWTLR
ncbi:hypothetical protein [Enterobacter sp. ZOR0014]|uniref:hypothetical protein n=1 Tax=Enterobacter sp. ZOR0014 TaxID=1339232 RepID=UPI0012E02A99|nr:hypothetical protein [Enterobacter sp. ZOR0014]